MPNYRRAYVAGGFYFFTVVTHRRQRILCNDDVRRALRAGIGDVRRRHPFDVDAWVLLPDHMHCIWRLPDGDADFPKRWAMIKRYVTKQCGHDLRCEVLLTKSRKRRRESTLWQRRYWERLIRDEDELNAYRNYIHWNPVKHGYVEHVSDWPHSTFHRFHKNHT